MKILLLTLAVLFLAGVCCLCKRVKSYCKSSDEAARLVIIVKDQEPWVEGFLRKLFLLAGGIPYLAIEMVDDGSSDQTREILARLQRVYSFTFSNQVDVMAKERNSNNDHFFDARGLTGRALLNAPVFSQLKALNAGKSSCLSK